ncbi:MAG TPA: NADH-quinone oxidoreductase subunit M [Verrucomicrobiae bacterium]|nr:NADH-quinone oxidoreductase subunit M [Verrucomicrobiae bacterium]
MISLLTVLILIPFFGALVVAGLGKQNEKLARKMALCFGFAALGLALWIWHQFDPSSGGFQFEERHLWIPYLGIEYRVGVDGLGLLMVVLTAIVTMMSMLASVEQRSAHGVHLYYALVLLLQAGLFGTFTALNFFHWFLFWELSLIPAFFLIRLWGGSQRAAAATQFFIYTMVGSVALLLAFLAIYVGTTDHVSDFTALAELARGGKLIPELGRNLGWHDLSTRMLAVVIFLGALLGFAVKTPLMPFHTWLPAAYAEAPTGTTMLLTGVMSKMGVYGFLRILLPIFPQQMHWLRTPLLALAVVTIIFSAGAALAQRDLKRILAYSSINHLGYCLLGAFAVATPATNVAGAALQKAAALNGVFLQMFNHGLTAATLFWFVSLLEQRNGGLRGIGDFGGLRKKAPVLCGLMGIALFASLGLPGLNGFVGEFLIFKGAFPLATCSASLAAIGLLVTAIFILKLIQRVFHGPIQPASAKMPDLTVAERWMLGVPIALIFLLGVYPQAVLGTINSTVQQMVEQLPF